MEDSENIIMVKSTKHVEEGENCEEKKKKEDRRKKKA